jgi:hypothetical protein
MGVNGVNNLNEAGNIFGGKIENIWRSCFILRAKKADETPHFASMSEISWTWN